MPEDNLLVLVADDEPSMLDLVADHLRQLANPRLEVIVAEDGEQALSLARERLPDLVVLDVMMPLMSGWEVCKRIREDVALAHTGVLMLTGIGQKVNELTSPLYKADAHIDKPFEFADLDEKIRAVLEARVGQRANIPHTAAAPAHAKPELKKAAARPKAKAKPKAKTKPKPKVRAKAKKHAKKAPAKRKAAKKSKARPKKKKGKR